MTKLDTVLRIIDTTSEWAGKVVSFLIFLIIGTMVWWVFLRYIFHMGTTWTYQTANKFFFIYTIFGAAYLLRLKAHTNTNILYRKFSPRTRGIVDLITSVFFFSFCAGLLLMAALMAGDYAPRFHLSLRTFWPPNWPDLLLAPVGILLLLLQGLAKFVRDLVTAITGKEMA